MSEGKFSIFRKNREIALIFDQKVTEFIDKYNKTGVQYHGKFRI